MSLQCLVDWVKLLNTLLEDCQKLPSGKEQLLELFRESSELPDIFFFVKCNKCQKRTKIQSDQKHGLMCCGEELKTTETNFFVIMPIESQIAQSVKENWDKINNLDTSGNNLDSYGDVHDGDILRNVLNDYKESDINILSLCINVDGANKFKSNSFSVWPIQLMQNFLPPHLRFLPENMILSGLYYHKSKDDNQFSFHEYMRPLIDELETLSRDLITICMEGDDFYFKPVITHCAVDLPAKSKIQETKQFGGYNACTYCEIPGERVLIEPLKSTTKTNRRKLKPKKSITMSTKTQSNSSTTESNKKPRYGVRYVEDGHQHKLRDEIETLEKMLTAAAQNECIDGIKDVSCLVGLHHFNIVWSLSVEYMHTVLQGVVKRLLNFFLNSKYSQKNFYIVPSKRKALNKRILKITPTSSIVRKPRSLNQLSNFKASENRSMLLYYLPICLPGCIPNVYVKHVRLLSAAVYILLKNRIPFEEVDRAEQMLNLFAKEHQDLFGKENMVMVVHLLKHMAQCVRKLGPLWGHSAFAFERNNGRLLKLVCGTSDVLHQISSKYCLGKSVHKQGNDIDTKKNDSAGVKILLGKEVMIHEKSSHILDVCSLEVTDFAGMSLSAHKRIKLRKVIFTSEMYTRPKRSIDYFIGLKCGIIGTAKYYFSYKEVICVMLNEFEIIDSINHIDKVIKTNRLIVAPIDEIEKKYLFMNVGLNYYIACRPNPYENE
ncbi:hypothetical protein HA402_008790 [Bradysia odoriphaga]|nr:hypothetical protein HA402_008790 [Bradysia odoriphaga]